jgi:transglutaminase-like putative cysteine protease
VEEQEAGHAWAEVKVPDVGWIGFDATNGISTGEAHLRVAVGLDYLGAAPIRGSRYGGGSESLAVHIKVDNPTGPPFAMTQSQWPGGQVQVQE